MESLLTLDRNIGSALAAARGAEGINFFSAITLLGKWELVLIATLIIGAVFWIKEKRSYILPFFVAVVGSQLSEFILKRSIQRPRPLNGAYLEDSFSFPSGHAVVAMAFYGFLMYFIWKNVADKFWRNALMFLGGAIILLVGFSRLYLGVHFLTDVLAGFIVGAFWLAIGIYLHKRTTPKI